MQETFDRELAPDAPRTGTARLGIVGGGQLARMTSMAALRLGCEVVVLERHARSPAASVATHSIVGDWEDPQTLIDLSSQVDVMSIENEFVSADALEAVERRGGIVRPGTATLRRVQDKLIQKQTFAQAGIPMPRFAPVGQVGDLARLSQEFGWPMVLKTRRNGYDGKGNFTLRSEHDAAEAWRTLGGDRQALYVEAFCPFVRELAVIITRGIDGAIVEYPVVETVQRDHICHVVRAPAPVATSIAQRVGQIARRAVEAIDGVGSFGVEVFLAQDEQVLLNEIAPRVHNSGHYTIEACVCSQFENHVRAVLGWPLGSPAMVRSAGVMINLLGAGKWPGTPRGLEQALGVPSAHVHLYGKAMSGPGRKMGHVTALGEDLAEAEAAASRAAKAIYFGEQA